MVLKANDRRTSCPCHDEFRGPRSDYVRQVALATTTTTASAIRGASGLYRISRKESLRGTIPIFSNFVATVGHSKM
ncbi:hypothetical protein TNCV_4613501 [Trichonephila clavipes]|nr:hypothetical protein TNCV_4613501 [Trichonephila clavipes]